MDSEGGRSAECDLVVQSSATRPLIVSENFHLVPVEWAYGLIEVKSHLDGHELQNAHSKIVRAKALRKLTYLPQTGDIQWGIDAYGQRFNYFPMYGLVFAYTGMSLESLCRELWALQHSEPLERWIDAVVVLDQGMLLHRNPQGGAVRTARTGVHADRDPVRDDLAPSHAHGSGRLRGGVGKTGTARALPRT